MTAPSHLEAVLAALEDYNSGNFDAAEIVKEVSENLSSPQLCVLAMVVEEADTWPQFRDAGAVQVLVRAITERPYLAADEVRLDLSQALQHMKLDRN